MELLAALVRAIDVDKIGQLVKDFITEDGIYFFFPLLMVFFALCGWVIHHFRQRDLPASGTIRRGAIVFYPPPIGIYYDPEATPMPSHELPCVRKRSMYPEDDPSGF